MPRGNVKAAQLGVLVGVVLYSTNAVFGAWAEVGGITFAFWRALLAVPVLAVVALAVDRRGTLFVRPGAATVLAGVLLGVSTVLVMSAAKRVPITLIALIGTLTPILTGLYEAARGERLGRPFYLSGLVAVIGTAYVALTEHETSANLAGIALAVGFAAGFAAFLIASRSARRTATPIGFLFWSALFACVPTTAIAVVAADPVLPLAARDLEALGLAVVCGGTTGHLLVTGSLRLLPATNAAVIRLTQPFFAMLFAWWIVAQEPTLPQIIGGLVTVAGVAGAALYRARTNVAPVEAADEPGL
ncbi:MAG TPA: DMT family transporter [Marmoricola sp.]|nr:DMT family transporter [Marmoricola sp.]